MNIKSKKYSAIIVSVLLVLSALSLPSIASADVIGEKECFPAVLMLRGSGEQSSTGVGLDTFDYVNDETNNTFVTTNGYEGPTLSKVVKSFVNNTDPSKTVSKVRFIGVKYPALPVIPTLIEVPDMTDSLLPEVTKNSIRSAIGIQNAAIIADHIVKYDASYRAGAQMAVDFINEDEQRGCDTQYMFLSYSQGVISARMAMNLLDNNSDKIVSSYALGDPFQKEGGATAPRQMTTANTSSNTSGTARFGLDTLLVLAMSAIVSQPQSAIAIGTAIDGLNSYREEVTKSDILMYRDEGINGVVSRSLCHAKDPVCGLDVLSGNAPDILQHTNYYDSSEVEGSIDLNHETAEFDKQVQKLANSTNLNPRKARILTKTPSVAGKSTTYNVANARPDDMCSWDENSDGTIEANTSCKTYTAAPASGNVKMTVHVTDSFGTQRTLYSDKKAIPSNTVNILTGLEPNTWYQLHPYNNPDKCVTLGLSKDSPNGNPGSMRIYDCFSANPSNYETQIDLSQQVFKFTPNVANSLRTKVISGYDDGYKWIQYAINETNILTHDMLGPPPGGYFNPKSQVIDGKIYYTFRNEDNKKCVEVIPNGYPMNSDLAAENYCGMNEAQLFSVTEVSSDPNAFGSFSLEKDTVNPGEINSITSTVNLNQLATLKWNHAIDNRAKYLSYNIYRYTSNGNIFIKKSLTNSSVVDLSSVPNQSVTFIIKAVDGAGNMSDGVSINLLSPPSSYSLPAPILDNIGSTRNNVTLSLPYDLNLPIRKIQVYRDGQLIQEINKGETVKDLNLLRGATYVYTYRLLSSNGFMSEMSEPLSASLTNNIAPSSPSHLSFENYQKNQINLIWHPAVDDIDFSQSLIYKIYRNGILLTQNYTAGPNGGVDSDIQPGMTYVYTVTATDIDGNTSVVSSPLSVAVPDTPPVQPTLTILYQTDTYITFEIISSDDNGTPIFDIYVNGQIYDSNYDNNVYTLNFTAGELQEINVVAKDSVGNSSTMSETILAGESQSLPSLAIDFQTTYNSHSVVAFSWARNNFNMGLKYDIYRNGVYIDTIYGGYSSRETYVDRNVSPDTEYSYTVLVNTFNGDVYDFSAPLTITTLADPNGVDTLAPSNIVLQYSSGDTTVGVQLMWTTAIDDSGSVQYKIYRDGILIDTLVDGTYYNDPNVVSASTYNYTIVATDATGNASSPLIIPSIVIP